MDPLAGLKEALALPVAALRKEPGAITLLVYAVLDAPPTEQGMAIERLLQLTEARLHLPLQEALPGRVVELFESEQPAVRRIAARLVVTCPHAAAIPGLIRCLADDDARVREDCILALRQADFDTSALVPHLGSERAEVREAALRVLHPPAPPSVRTELQRLLGDDVPGVRHLAAGFLPDDDDTPGLWGVTVDALRAGGDESTRIQAAGRLGRLEPLPETSEVLLEALRAGTARVRAAAAEALARFSPTSTQVAGALLGSLHDSSSSVARRAAAALSVRGPATEALAPSLLVALEDSSVPEEVRGQVALALGRLGVREAIPPLSRLLDRPDSSFRLVLDAFSGLSSLPGLKHDAVVALGLFGPLAAETAPALSRLAREGGPALRHAASEALGYMGLFAS
ncbi:HEAT repeat domain-containing protein [Archangium lipolyticum]|uniref:HEAT repeat domain-containing protein n=1 Tax=Archangium lipolyticum TaxID=2970465 RepID=UPI00214A5887|nr:HEAT repeat domain-containing protein [Archangium lipolyticum]